MVVQVVQVVHEVDGAMVPAFGDTRVPGIVPGLDPRPLHIVDVVDVFDFARTMLAMCFFFRAMYCIFFCAR